MGTSHPLLPPFRCTQVRPSVSPLSRSSCPLLFYLTLPSINKISSPPRPSQPPPPRPPHTTPVAAWRPSCSGVKKKTDQGQTSKSSLSPPYPPALLFFPHPLELHSSSSLSPLPLLHPTLIAADPTPLRNKPPRWGLRGRIHMVRNARVLPLFPFPVLLLTPLHLGFSSTLTLLSPSFHHLLI